MTVLVAHKPLGAQAQRILQLLVERGSLTAKEAYEAGCGMRLAARVLEIREAFGESAVVTRTEEHDGGTHARYYWRGQVEPQTELGL